MITFEQAQDMLRAKDRKKVDHNTWLERVDHLTYGIRFHNTLVVLIHQNGTFELNSGGWQTVTTKARINNHAPVSLHRTKHVWYIDRDNKVPFKDHMVVDSNGKVVVS